MQNDKSKIKKPPLNKEFSLVTPLCGVTFWATLRVDGLGGERTLIIAAKNNFEF